MKTFIERCLAGEASPHDINDAIDVWHENAGDQDLHEFLGLTAVEFQCFANDARSLDAILTERRQSTAS